MGNGPALIVSSNLGLGLSVGWQCMVKRKAEVDRLYTAGGIGRFGAT